MILTFLQLSDSLCSERVLIFIPRPEMNQDEDGMPIVHFNDTMSVKTRPIISDSPQQEVTVGNDRPGRSSLVDLLKDQIPFRDPSGFLFRTDRGYKGGYIMTDRADSDSYQVLFTRDELGSEICEVVSVPKIARVVPTRKSKKTVWLYTFPDLSKSGHGEVYAEAFIRAGNDIDIGEGFGSGVTGQSTPPRQQRHKFVKYPIYRPLTLHNEQHRETLSCASSFLSQAVDEYLGTGLVSDAILDQTCWLLNVVLYVDGQPNISKTALLEAIGHFCYDYRNLHSGTLLRQPLNYVLDIARVDGIWSKHSTCISFITTDFEGVIYRFS